MRRFLPVFLFLPLLAGCATMERLDAVRSSAEKLIEDSVESAAIATAPSDNSLLTREEAERIALEKVERNRGQISRLQTKYEWENGRHIYEVEFHQGPWEYHYEIDAATGQVLEWDREKED
jgi:uncharacterized membrane protein YkoI